MATLVEIVKSLPRAKKGVGAVFDEAIKGLMDARLDYVYNLSEQVLVFAFYHNPRRRRFVMLSDAFEKHQVGLSPECIKCRKKSGYLYPLALMMYHVIDDTFKHVISEYRSLLIDNDLRPAKGKILRE